MKKLLVLLLVSALAIFVFAGCDLIPSEGEGEGEGEGEVEEVTVEIDGAVEIGGNTYVSAGNHDITVTFPAPVTGNVSANITGCSGDFSKDKGNVVLIPNEDRTVWTGSGFFGLSEPYTGYLIDIEDIIEYGEIFIDEIEYHWLLDCCASYLEIVSGECEDEVCIDVPVIVDSEPPDATIELCLDDCACEGCTLSFKSTSKTECDVTTDNCGDDCSGLASWSIAVFDFEEYVIGQTPYDECCEIPCEEPIFTCDGTACPINCTTSCLKQLKEGNGVFVVVTLVDNVGNDVKWGTYVESCDYDTCSMIKFVPYTSGVAIDNKCLDNATGVFTKCKDNTVCPVE